MKGYAECAALKLYYDHMYKIHMTFPHTTININSL